MGSLSPASSDSSLTARIDAVLARPDLRDLLAALNTNGDEARVVGGAVRDLVMARPIGDLDVATTALPEEVKQTCEALGWKVVPTGIDHGTVTVVINKQPYEVTTLRRDVETDGRRAVVAFTRDFREDAFRRDFTINALSLDLNGIIHDYGTGLSDAKAGRIRFMGDPETRIREDYLRILRFFRFSATHASNAPDSADLAMIAERREGLTTLSRERVRQELMKLLAAPAAADVCSMMADLGLWPLLVSASSVRLDVLKRLTSLEHNLSINPSALRRLAALVPWSETLAEDLRLSKHEQAWLSGLARNTPRFHDLETSEALLKRQVFEAGYLTIDATLVGGAEAALSAPHIAALLAALKPHLDQPPVNPFTSAMVAALGIEPGPVMGAILQQAKTHWLDEGLPVGNTAIRRILEQAAAGVLANTHD
jgi:poly(A) polymerase